MAAMPTPSTTPTPVPAHRVDSMTLLRDLVEDSLDEGYARAAARRAADPDGGGRVRGRGALLVVGLVAVGLLLATAYVQTRSRAGNAQEAHSALIATVQQKEHANDAEQRRLDRLRAAVQRDQQAGLALTAAGRDLAARLGRLESSTGTGAVEGPGMTVHVADAGPSAAGSDVDPRTDQQNPGRVTDRDLQTLVNEVWASGAEAVAVNGQRLTVLSAIRSAGDAVLVDFRPLNPPYTLQAIGPDTMRTTFTAGFGGSYLQVLQGYGITSSVEDSSRLRLPASAGVSLRYAEVPAPPSPRPSGSGAAGGSGTGTSSGSTQ
jgi:uncharacterized protein YlxW (UPF0749 family)